MQTTMEISSLFNNIDLSLVVENTEELSMECLKFGCMKADPGCKSSRIRGGVLGNAFLMFLSICLFFSDPVP